MVKEIAQLLVTFGIIGGIALAPTSFVKPSEPDLELPVVGTYENLKKLVEESEESNYRGGIQFGVVSDLAMNAVAKSEAVMESASDDFSTTNVQVNGVDEGDIIKNDGKFLYHLTNRSLVISEIAPASDMKVLSRTEFEDFDASELYLTDEHVIVLGTYYKETKKRYYGESYTKALIYDLSDRTSLKLVKEVEVSGYYNSSRLIEDCLYFVTNKDVFPYMFEDDYDVLPLYRDSAVNEELVEVSCEEIKYFPDNKCNSYMTTVGIDLEKLDKSADISTYVSRWIVI